MEFDKSDWSTMSWKRKPHFKVIFFLILFVLNFIFSVRKQLLVESFNLLFELDSFFLQSYD